MSDNKRKPIPIRLPSDLEESLRLTAFSSKKTINAVVIESLKQTIPAVQDLSSYSGDELLHRYSAGLQVELNLLLALCMKINTQIADVQSAIRHPEYKDDVKKADVQIRKLYKSLSDTQLRTYCATAYFHKQQEN